VLRQTLEPGRTVVVTRMTAGNVEGKLLAIDPDSITVHWHGNPQVVKREDVYRVRIANIRRKHTLIGMAIGFAAGAVVGGTGADRYKGLTALFAGFVGLGMGAAAGGVLPIGPPLYQVDKPGKRAATPTSEE
jgi:hypothetical protein